MRAAIRAFRQYGSIKKGFSGGKGPAVMLKKCREMLICANPLSFSGECCAAGNNRAGSKVFDEVTMALEIEEDGKACEAEQLCGLIPCLKMRRKNKADRNSRRISSWLDFAGLAYVVCCLGCASTPKQVEAPLTQIAFASCINTNSHPGLDQFLKAQFDLALMIGDNIYADTTNMTVMEGKYDALKGSEFWKELRRRAPVMATWDDHDFGGNDAGADYPMKDESQRLFLEFMDEPEDSARWRRPGVYDTKVFGPVGRRVQVILLDTRYFRSKPLKGENNVVPSGGRYIPNPDPNATILGETQWRWLEEQLREPAELRIIGSSIQFISEFSGAEAWANFPHEKKRMLELVANVRKGLVLFISGDRHWSELSRMPLPDGGEVYDFTSSALTQKHPRGTPTPNKYREGPTYHDANFGLIQIEWKGSTPVVTLRLVDATGGVRLEKKI